MKRKTECECGDPGCPCLGQCHETATTTLYRIDMCDYTGTPMCQVCAEDAMESGVFSHRATDGTDAD